MFGGSEGVAGNGLLTRLADAVPVGLLQLDSGRRCVYSNDRLHEILGAARAETLEAQMVSLVPAHQAMLAAAIDSADWPPGPSRRKVSALPDRSGDGPPADRPPSCPAHAASTSAVTAPAKHAACARHAPTVMFTPFGPGFRSPALMRLREARPLRWLRGLPPPCLPAPAPLRPLRRRRAHRRPPGEQTRRS